MMLSCSSIAILVEPHAELFIPKLRLGIAPAEPKNSITPLFVLLTCPGHVDALPRPCFVLLNKQNAFSLLIRASACLTKAYTCCQACLPCTVLKRLLVARALMAGGVIQAWVKVL